MNPGLYQLNFRKTNLLKQIAHALKSIPDLEIQWSKSVNGISDRLQLDLGQKAYNVSDRLKNGNPRVFLGEEQISKGILIIDPLNLDEKLTPIVAERLRAEITEL